MNPELWSEAPERIIIKSYVLVHSGATGLSNIISLYGDSNVMMSCL